MKEKINVSVVIAVYNMEKYLAQCLDSVIAQDLQNIEILCINDGSKDSSLEILNQYAEKDSRIRILSQENKGFALTRNRGIDEAKGKYLVFMDPDDWYPTNDILRNLYKAVTSKKVMVCGGCFSEFNERTGKFKNIYGGILKDYVFEQDGYLSYKDYQFDYGPHRFIYNVEFLRTHNLYFPNRARFQDTTFLIKTLEQCEKFYVINKIVYCYRLGHQETIWNEKKGTDLVLGIIENLDFAEKHHYAKLYYLTAHRLFVDFYTRVLPCCTEENTVIKNAIESIKKNFNWNLIKEYKQYDKFYDNVMSAFYNQNAIQIPKMDMSCLKNHNVIKVNREDGTFYKTDKIAGLNINFVGSNSCVELFEPMPIFNQCSFTIGNACYIKIDKSRFKVTGFNLMMTAEKSKLLIGRNFSCNGCSIALRDESNLVVKIGNNCMFSIGIKIRTSDGHAILDGKTKQVINRGENIIIGDNVWIGAHVSILKGCVIPEGCVVGTCAVVSKKKFEPNSVLVGMPARTIRKNISWSRLNTEMYLKEMADLSFTKQIEEKVSANECPYVSIVVPIYNVENYLRECLNSVVNQTLKNIEIICVNDGSTDNSPQIIKEFMDKDNRIKLISHTNHGYGYSMNAGFAAATGKYIGIVEPDDYIDVNMYEKLFVAAEKYNLECVKSDYYLFSGDGENREIQLKKLSSNKTELYYSILTPRYNTDAFYFSKNNWTGIYKRDFIESCGIKHNETPGASYQDNGFWFQVFSRVNKLMFIQDAFYYYRQDNPNSSINNKGKAFIIFDEWDFIRRKCYKNLETFIGVREMYVRHKYNSLKWHYSRIDNQYKAEFMDRFKEFLIKAKNYNLINNTIFTEKELTTINEIISDINTNKVNQFANSKSVKNNKVPLKRKIINFIKKLPGIRYLNKKLVKISENEKLLKNELNRQRLLIERQNQIINELRNKL